MLLLVIKFSWDRSHQKSYQAHSVRYKFFQKSNLKVQILSFATNTDNYFPWSERLASFLRKFLTNMVWVTVIGSSFKQKCHSVKMELVHPLFQSLEWFPQTSQSVVYWSLEYFMGTSHVSSHRILKRYIDSRVTIEYN